MPVRVLVAEDDASIRALLADLIEEDDSLTLAGMAADAAAAIAVAGETHPDVALVDVNMPGGGGVRATREIARCSPETRVVALSGDNGRQAVLDMVAGGAVGYLVKGMPLVELVAAIHRAARGDSVLSPIAATSLVDEVAVRIQRDDQAARAQRARIGRVRRLLDDGFEIALQPIRELRGGRTVGFEALARFDAVPDRGPAFWFAEAEAVGLRAELELKAIGLALIHLSFVPADLYLSLNVSPDVLVSPDFRDVLVSAPLDRLVLEVTEHAQVDDYGELNRATKAIRRGGARLAIDDAGAGFASLRHILQLAPDFIKLDVSLTREIDRDRTRRALASALIAFAAETGAAIVAEGVEREAQLHELSALGVRFGQGYYLGKPAVVAEAA